MRKFIPFRINTFLSLSHLKTKAICIFSAILQRYITKKLSGSKQAYLYMARNGI